MGKLGKKYKMPANIESYTHLIMGDRKIGKSTLVKDIAVQEYGSIDALLSLSIGNEDGFEAINGLIYENPTRWGQFVSIVDELIENQDEYDFRIVAVDTIDELVRLAGEETIRQSNLKNPEKKVDTLNAAFGGYYAGPKYMFNLINEQLTRLKDSKYGLFMVAHNKMKKRRDSSADEGYDIITTNLSTDEFNTFAYKATIVCNITLDRKLENGVTVGTQRLMNFRSDGIIDAGSRLKNLPNGVKFGADNYIRVVKDAIRAELGVDEKELEERSEADYEKQKEDAKKSAKKEAEDKKSGKSLTREQKLEFIGDSYKNSSDAEMKSGFLKKINDEFSANKITELPEDELQKAYEYWAKAKEE